MSTLANFRRSVYSQNGEDGVIAEIFRRLPVTVPRWYVEFGAWDGRYGSNCYVLALAGWHGVMIEGDPTRFLRLKRTASKFAGSMIGVRSFVESGSHLEEILCDHKVPTDFGLLSIDIDSSDYEIWNGMSQFRPAVVVIEIDSSTPPGVRRIWNGEDFPATTFTSMVELGRSKGYTAVCHTGNLVFVRDDLMEPFVADVPEDVDQLFLSDWINPTRFQIWRRKASWTSPQRLMCKVQELMSNFVFRTLSRGD